MDMPSNDLHQVELLSEGQIAQFKRDGLLVLPGVLDLDLCRQVQDLYCTLPNSPPPADHYRGAHSEAMYDTHWRLQIAAYIDDVPANAGGLMLWPGSRRIRIRWTIWI